jgi:hypothetical protein
MELWLEMRMHQPVPGFYSHINQANQARSPTGRSIQNVHFQPLTAEFDVCFASLYAGCRREYLPRYEVE